MHFQILSQKGRDKGSRRSLVMVLNPSPSSLREGISRGVLTLAPVEDEEEATRGTGAFKLLYLGSFRKRMGWRARQLMG